MNVDSDALSKSFSLFPPLLCRRGVVRIRRALSHYKLIDRTSSQKAKHVISFYLHGPNQSGYW